MSTNFFSEEKKSWIKGFRKNLVIKLDSVDSYFSTPKKDREFLGLYKTPHALPAELFFLRKSQENEEKGWGYFYEQIRKQYPVQWFFRHWLFCYDNPVYFFFKSLHRRFLDLKWATKNFLKPNYSRWRNSLKRHEYKDISYLFEESNLNLILDFYHEEVVDGWVDWKADELHKKFYVELLENVRWIEEEKIKKQQQLDEATTYAVDNPVFDNFGKLDYYSTYRHVHALEESLENKTTQILKWFCDNRKMFWT